MKGIVKDLVGTLHIEKGGPGSGHPGHAGRLGKRGGSLPGVGIVSGLGGNPRVLADRPNLVFVNPPVRNPRARGANLTDDEMNVVREAISDIDLPDWVGRGQAPVSIRGRIPPRGDRELATTNGSIIFINKHPGAFDDLPRLRKTLAHEFGHVIIANRFRIEQRFESEFGKGPYKKGSFGGVTNLHHLQNSREMLSRLYSDYATGESVGSSVRDFIRKEVF